MVVQILSGIDCEELFFSIKEKLLRKNEFRKSNLGTYIWFNINQKGKILILNLVIYCLVEVNSIFVQF